MHTRVNKIMISLIITCFTIGSIFKLSSQMAFSANSPYSLVMTKSEKNENIYYTVGMGYADIWTNSAGDYIADPYNGQIIAPGQTIVSHDEWSYQFNFPGRKVKNVQVSTYPKSNIVNGETQEWTDRMFKAARYGDPYNKWEKQIATVMNIYDKGLTGNGTDTAIQTVSVKAILDAPNPIIITPGPPFADGVTYQRQYFPFLFRIELEPLEGQAIIKHFTTTGQPLNGIDGFRDRTEKLIKDQPYGYTHTPETSNYKYVGYQESTQSEPMGGPQATGDPPGFTYSGKYPIYYVYFYYERKGGPPPTDGCTNPSPSGQVKEVPLNSPDVSAVIKADSRGAERFDVLDGIPTTESLYGNVIAKSYLSKYKFVEMSGKCTFNVTVNKDYELSWDPGKEVTAPDGTTHTEPDPQTATESVSKSYAIERDYSYWVIENLEVYKIGEAALWNFAFDGNGIRITPSGYSPPTYASAPTSGFTPPSPPSQVNAPSERRSGGKTRPNVPDQDLSSDAENAVDQVKVNNDTLTFNGSTIMDGSQTEKSGASPRTIPVAALIGENVLYSPGNIIPVSKTNKADQPSTGTIYYAIMGGNINGGADTGFPIYGINSVTVHTPVVIYPSVSDDKAHNQKTNPAAGRSAIILERSFTVEMPNKGQHTDYLGYGNRNYVKYIGSKQVRFPFDVYDGTKAFFYPKNSWIEVDKAKDSFTFYLPVWVDEGFYEIEFRTIAHNAPTAATSQTNANLNLTHHAAYDTVPVDVVGRLYDFRITDIADYHWETVFRSSAGFALPTGAAYWVGLNGIDGAPRGNGSRFTLPIRSGSHPVYNNAVIKTGYHFKFELKTKGNMFGLTDQIRITPSFDFVDAKTGFRLPVDLYYHAGNHKYVKIGSPADQVERYVILNDRLRNVPLEELTDTALYKYDHDYTFNQIAGVGRARYVNWFIEKATKQKTPVGSLSLLELNEGTRTLIGPKTGIPSGVDSARANASIQKWYGEYSLPADVYVVAAGTHVAEYGRTHNGLTERSPIFLRDGYIIVNFNIESIRSGAPSNPYLQYINAPLMNQWYQMEGYSRTVTDPYGRTFALRDGDIVFYDASRSSRDDFVPMITH